MTAKYKAALYNRQLRYATEWIVEDTDDDSVKEWKWIRKLSDVIKLDHPEIPVRVIIKDLDGRVSATRSR